MAGGEGTAAAEESASQALTWPEDIGTRPTRVMVVGLGALGSRVLDGLVRLGDAVSLLAAGRDEAAVRSRANLSLFSGMQTSASVPSVASARIDLADIGLSAEVLSQQQPDVVVNCASMQPYRSIAALSERQRQRLEEAGLGPWLPAHLALVDRLMQAVEISEARPHVVNCAYPDAVNPALAGVGRAPLAGAGNVANNEPALRLTLANATGVDPAGIRLSMVMHHFVSHRIHRLGDAGGAPFHLSYELGSKERRPPSSRLRNVRRQSARPRRPIPAADLFRLLARSHPRAQGDVGRLMPAASAVSIVRCLVGDRVRRLHAPGPIGQIGGMPVELSRGGVRIALPRGLDLARAAAINAAAQRYDGIAAIGPGGEVAHTDEARRALREAIGYDCEPFQVADAWERASELARCAERAAGA